MVLFIYGFHLCRTENGWLIRENSLVEMETQTTVDQPRMTEIITRTKGTTIMILLQFTFPIGMVLETEYSIIETVMEEVPKDFTLFSRDKILFTPILHEILRNSSIHMIVIEEMMVITNTKEVSLMAEEIGDVTASEDRVVRISKSLHSKTW